MPTTSIKAHIGRNHYQTILSNSRQELSADEPMDIGGTDLGFAPDELLCAALASCTAITLRMYADRKEWPLEAVRLEISLERDKASNTTKLTRAIELEGDLNEEQRERLLGIANACPVHKTLTNPVVVDSFLVEGG